MSCSVCHMNRWICNVCETRLGKRHCAAKCCKLHLWQQVGLFVIVEQVPLPESHLAYDLVRPISYLPPPVLPDLELHMKAIQTGLI